MKKLIILILSCLLITGCNINNQVDNPLIEDDTSNKQQENIDDYIITNDIEKFKEEYTSGTDSIKVDIPENSFVHYASVQEVLDILTSGSGIIYFGRPTCPWCRNIVPVLLEAAKQNNMYVNYLNASEIPADKIDIYVKIKDKIKDYLKENSKGEKTLYVPDVYFVKDGNVVGHKLSSVSSQHDPFTPLNEEQRQELIDIYDGFIKQIR